LGNQTRLVTVVDTDGDPVSIDANQYLRVIQAGQPDVTMLTATKSTTASGTNTTVIAAPGAGISIVITGILVTIETEAKVLLHWGDGTTDPVMEFDYLSNSGVAFSYGFHGPKSAANEALKIDVDATSNVITNIWYYED